MRDVPVIMSAPMVLATLREVERSGTGKTMTRRFGWGPRFEKATDDEGGYRGWRWGQWVPGSCAWPSSASLINQALPWDTQRLIGHMAPTPWQSVKPGDRLWIRENFFAFGRWVGVKKAGNPRYAFVRHSQKAPIFAADFESGRPLPAGAFAQGDPAWHLRPNIFLPRAESRLTLIVTATKIERLKDITPEDAVREGLIFVREQHGFKLYTHGLVEQAEHVPHLGTPVSAFADLWNRLHGAGAWDANPEVVAVSFKPVLANVLTLEKEAA